MCVFFLNNNTSCLSYNIFIYKEWFRLHCMITNLNWHFNKHLSVIAHLYKYSSTTMIWIPHTTRHNIYCIFKHNTLIRRKVQEDNRLGWAVGLKTVSVFAAVNPRILTRVYSIILYSMPSSAVSFRLHRYICIGCSIQWSVLHYIIS